MQACRSCPPDTAISKGVPLALWGVAPEDLPSRCHTVSPGVRDTSAALSKLGQKVSGNDLGI